MHKPLLFQKMMKIPLPGEDLIVITLMMNYCNVFITLWKRRIPSRWLEKRKSLSWGHLKLSKLAPRRRPSSISRKSPKCKWTQILREINLISKCTNIALTYFFFRLHRQPKHLLAFLFAELGTTGAIDGNNQLVMKGKFQQKHIENVLRRYIKEYVTCHTCRSPDTILNKETRLFFLQCMKCHSKCSVQTIKTGFQAVTGSRKAARNKQ